MLWVGWKWEWRSLSHVRFFVTPIRTILYSPWNSPGQNIGVGNLFLLQRIFPTQGLNPGLPPCRQILYQLSHKGSPRMLEWVAFSFFSRSSCPRNQTWVCCIVGRFFTNWATREPIGCIPSLTVNFSHLGTSVSAKQLKDIVCIPWWGIRTLPHSCTVVSLGSFYLVLHHLPSLISSCLNLPVGTQRRS